MLTAPATPCSGLRGPSYLRLGFGVWPSELAELPAFAPIRKLVVAHMAQAKATVVGLGPVLLNTLPWILEEGKTDLFAVSQMPLMELSDELVASVDGHRSAVGHRGTRGPRRPGRTPGRAAGSTRESDSGFGTPMRWATLTVCTAANPIIKAALGLTLYPCNRPSGNLPLEPPICPPTSLIQTPISGPTPGQRLTARRPRKLRGPIWVVGGSGFIGAKLVFSLARIRSDVFAVSKRVESSWRLLHSSHGNTVPCDITQKRDVAAAVLEHQPKTIFNLAAYGAYERQSAPDQIHAVNYTGTLHLIQALLETGCDAFVQAGSSSEYGFNCAGPSEFARLEPNSNYAVSKVSALPT